MKCHSGLPARLGGESINKTMSDSRQAGMTNKREYKAGANTTRVFIKFAALGLKFPIVIIIK